MKEHSSQQSGCTALNSAIQKYGFEAFQKEILLEIHDKHLDDYERKLIDTLNTICPYGYNIRSGGKENSTHCAESWERMRRAKLGAKNPNYGKPRSISTKYAISQQKQGEKHHFYGKHLTEAHKQALSQSHKQDRELPMYLVRVNARPKHYTSDGYAIVNHPILPNRYFTSKSLDMFEKLHLAVAYLETGNMDAVQRLNGDGLKPPQEVDA
jgi:group I intron endonuclease